MKLRNGEHGYGAITKFLHWLTVIAFTVQFLVGYTMEADEDEDEDSREVDCDHPGEDRSGGDTSEAEEEEFERFEERCEAGEERSEEDTENAVGDAWSEVSNLDFLGDGLSLPEIHVLIGLLIIGLGVLRVLWRSTNPLPPWDPRLTPGNQRVIHGTETVLLTLQFVVPITGIVLVAGDDDMLWLHVTGHIAFFAALAAHLGMVFGKRLLPRMLPGGRHDPAGADSVDPARPR